MISLLPKILQFLFCLSLFVKPNRAEDLQAGKEVFHFPRNKRPRTPFGGIRDILAYSPSGSDERGKRSCSHNVSMNGFNLAYNVTLVKGVFSIDDDDRVLHINCDYDTGLVQVELISSDPQSLMKELSASRYMIGDHSWGCLSGMYGGEDEYRAEPIYRKIVNITRLVPENNSIILTTAVASFAELFESTNIRLDIAPNFVSPFISSMNNEENGHPVQNDQASNRTRLRKLSSSSHNSKDLQGVYSSQTSYQFSYNYDPNRQVAQSSQVPLDSFVTCEECFYNFNPGFIFNLDIELSSYFIPYAQNLEMSFYGSGVISAYMRMKMTQVKASQEYALTEKISLPPINLFIFLVPFIIYPSFQMYAQYNITDASLPVSIFGGFTATATNVKHGYKTVAGGTANTVISGASYSFKGTPLSTSYDKSKAISGSFQPRLYLIPRVYLSPYGLVNFAIDVKPYLGLALWTSGLGLPSNPYSPTLTVDQFNALSVPLQPSAPVVSAVNQNSAYITIPLPNAADSSVYYYQVRMKSTSILSFFSDYVTLSELGYFQSVYIPNCLSATYYSSKPLSTPYNTPIQCSQLCYGDGQCNAYKFTSSTNNCYLFNISSSLLRSSSGCAYNYTYRNMYQIRDSDPFGYTVNNDVATSQAISFKLASNSFYVSYRALNEKGYSSWSADSTVAFSVTATMAYVGSGNIFLQVSLTSNLKVGEVVTVNVYQYGTLSSKLLTSQNLTTSYPTSSLTIPIGNYLTSPFTGGWGAGNNLQLYSKVNYPSTHQVYSGYFNSMINYHPVVITLYNFYSTYLYYEFYANPNQISSVRLQLSFCKSYFLGVCTNTNSVEASDKTSTLCSNGFCSWTITYNFASGTTYTLSFYATDVSGSEVSIQSNNYPSRRRRMTEDIVDDVDGSTTAQQSQLSDSDTAHQSPVEQSYLEISSQTATGQLDHHHHSPEQQEEEDAQTHLLGDISWLQGYTYCAPQTTNGLNYAFFYGVDIAISMQAFSVFGFVLFPMWQSRNFAVISPTVFADLTFGTGCLILPPIPPSIVVKSPVSTDKWGLTTKLHRITWDYYSIATNASVSICINDCSSLSKVKCIYAQPINSPYTLFLDPSLFVTGKKYFATVAYSPSVYGQSDCFTVVSPASDLSRVISMSDQPYDDSFTSIGTIFSFDTVSIHTLPGTRCQAHYKNYPLNVFCTVTLGINVSSLNIYKFTLTIGLSVNNATNFKTKNFGLLYGINFPAFVFPSTLKSDSSVVSYFLQKLAGKKLINGASFPTSSNNGTSLAQVMLSPGGQVCLSSLINVLAMDTSDYNSCSDITLAAQQVSKLIGLLGMDACLIINIASVDAAKGGLIFQAMLNTIAFDATKIDWSEYLGQKTSNPFMQDFTTLSGTSTSNAVSSIFQNMLKILHIPSKIEMDKNFGSFASSLLYPKKQATGISRRRAASASVPSFIDSNGNFLLGSSATGQTTPGTPSTMPTKIVSSVPLSPSPSANPSKGPTAGPTASAGPTPSPTAIPTNFPTMQRVSILAMQSISGINISQYHSSKNYSLTLQSAIAGCLSDVKLSDVQVLNVSALLSSSRRRLEIFSTAVVGTTTTPSGIKATYQLTLESSKFNQSFYEWQLKSTSANGKFTAQLKKFSSQYFTPGFKNVTSLGVVLVSPSISPTPSPSPPPSPTGSSGGCFAGFETVQMESGDAKALQDVVVGDRILSYSIKRNEFVFSPVVALLGNNPDGNTVFSELSTSDGESLALTPDHLVQAGSCDSASSSFALKQARKVVAGECLLASAAGGLNKRRVVAKGAFSVVTNHDFIVISGVVASPFSVNHPLPDLFYGLHRYLFQHYPQWMHSSVALSSLKLTASVLSFFADASRPLLGGGL